MDLDGLTQVQAEKKLKEHGLNQISKKQKTTDWQLLFDQIKSPFIYVLLAAMGVTGFLLKDPEDTIVIGLAVVFNTLLGFFQERKANRSLEALASVLTPHTKVKRDGKWQIIKANQVVPGDLVRLEIGNKIPADGKVTKEDSLMADEAILTGESAPVVKVKDKKVYMGTIVAGGIGQMVVTDTGESTKFGQIAESLKETQKETTPLQKQINKFAKVMAAIVLVTSTLVMVVGLLVGDSFREIFPTAVALAVAAIPEGLAVSLTVILAIGMQRILKRKALVRKMLAAETLGGVTVICADKTGTLTEGKMRVVKLLESLSPDPKVRKLKLELVKKAAILVNDMRDPLEVSMMNWAASQVDDKDITKKYPRLDEIPFDPKWRYIATLHRQPDKKENLLLISGAPEEVLGRCETAQQKRKEWQEAFTKEGKAGHRLVGFAFKETTQAKMSDKQVVKLRWLGCLVYEDPVRESVKDALTKFRKAGIEVKVITGDYRFTAEAVLNKLSVAGKDILPEQVMEGEELNALSPTELSERIDKIVLFARTNPQQKLRIVEALQQRGEVVAMTGDGVNDAPALKKADIGIVVNEASDVSKEIADMVLLNNDFNVILAAIEGGRLIQDNLKKVVLYLLADSFGEIFLVVFSLIARIPLPVTAAMILWVNLVSDGFPDLALTMEPAEKNLLKRQPNNTKQFFIDSEMGLLILLISLASAVTAFAAFWYYWHHPAYGLIHARSMAFSLLGLNSLFYVWSARSLTEPIWRVNIFKNIWLILAVLVGLSLQLLGLYSPFGQRLLGTVGIDIKEWAVVLLGSLVMMVIVEGVKWSYNRKR